MYLANVVLLAFVDVNIEIWDTSLAPDGMEIPVQCNEI